MQQGFLMRTPRGRVATRRAWQHFGLNIPEHLGNNTPTEGTNLELFE
nr:hypothetical protein [Thiothrix sp. UBA2332]